MRQAGRRRTRSSWDTDTVAQASPPVNVAIRRGSCPVITGHADMTISAANTELMNRPRIPFGDIMW